MPMGKMPSSWYFINAGQPAVIFQAPDVTLS